MSVEYKDWFPKVTSACFNLTDACNLKCRYCFVEQHPHFMTLDVAKKGVEFLVNNYNWKKEHGLKPDGVSVTYFGGEPMLLYDEIIKPLTLWCEERFPNLINFSITTNGTLLNEERIIFLKEHKIYPLLSIDGAPDTQNFNRPCQNENLNSFDLVYKNIPCLLEHFPNTTFRATIDQNTVGRTFENYLFAAFCGFKNIYMIPNSHIEWTEDQLMLLDREFNKIFNHMLLRFENNKMPLINCSPINDSFLRVLQRDLATVNNTLEEYKTTREVRRCGVGVTGCSIGYNGNIYGCQEQDSKDSNDIFYIGNIETGIDVERHKRLLSAYSNTDIVQCYNKEVCDSCPLRPICKTYICPSTSWSTFGNLTTNGNAYCYWLQIMFHGACQLMKILTEENNETFHTYLKEKCHYDSYFKEGY